MSPQRHGSHTGHVSAPTLNGHVVTPGDRRAAEYARQRLALVGMDPDDIAEERWQEEMDARDRFDEMGPAA